MPKLVTEIGEPWYSMLSFSVVLIVVSGLYIIAEEFYLTTKVKDSTDEKKIDNYNENGNLLLGFIALLMPIFSVLIVIALINLGVWKNDYDKGISIGFFVFALCTWILANGNMGEKFKTIEDIKSAAVKNIQEKNKEIQYGTGNYGFTIKI